MKKKSKINEASLKDLRDNINPTNIHKIGFPEGQEREKEAENWFQEIMYKNFPTQQGNRSRIPEIPKEDEPEDTHTQGIS